MVETIEELLEQLEVGEDSYHEFKELEIRGTRVRSPNTESMAGEITAFANAEGGKIWLGVDDDGIVQGISKDDLDLVEEWILNIASNNCEPPARLTLRKKLLPNPAEDEVPVMFAEIKPSPYVHQTSGGRWYIRDGSKKRDLSGPELARLFQQRGKSFVYDEMVVSDSDIEDINVKKLKRVYDNEFSISIEDFMRNVRILSEDEEGNLRPTIAGLLVFGEEPQEFLQSSFIEAAVYRGKKQDSDDLVTSQKIVGTIDKQIDEAVEFVDRFMLKPAKKDVGRKDFPQYNLSAVHEAIVNAVAHRDYSISGSKIRLFLFNNRLELYSPGDLPNTITLESLPYRQFTRNQLLVSFLSKIKSEKTGRYYIEERGEGVKRILTLSEEHSGRKPEYQLLENELLLTIWAKEEQ